MESAGKAVMIYPWAFIVSDVRVSGHEGLDTKVK